MPVSDISEYGCKLPDLGVFTANLPPFTTRLAGHPIILPRGGHPLVVRCPPAQLPSSAGGQTSCQISMHPA